MIYKFRIVSDEVDNFKREICIDSDASFLELHDAILDSVGFSKDQMTSVSYTHLTLPTNSRV